MPWLMIANEAIYYDLFGGNSENGRLNDTWVWNGTAWHANDAPSGAIPSARFDSAMAY